MNRILLFITFLGLTVAFTSCNKKDDPRLKYVGNWNFKHTTFTYSGYYQYTPNPTWVSNSTTTTLYNDSTGSIALGTKEEQLIIKYCGTCAERVYDLEDGGSANETLNYTTYEYVQDPPVGYSSYYTTKSTVGQKL